MTRYRAGLASAPIACFMVTYNKHTLGLEDLSTLEEQNWLNDQVGKENERLSCLHHTSSQSVKPSNKKCTSKLESINN